MRPTHLCSCIIHPSIPCLLFAILPFAGLIVSSMAQQRMTAMRINGRLMMRDHGRSVRQCRQCMMRGNESGRCGMSVRRQNWYGCLYDMMGTRRLGDNGIETVHRIGRIVDGASAAVRFDQRVLTVNDITVARLVLLLIVAGNVIGNGIAEIVVWMRIVRLGSDGMMGNANRMRGHTDGDRLHGNGADGD